MTSTPAAESKYPAPVIQGEAARARAFAAPLLAGQLSLAGEDRLAHADGVLAILEGMDADAEVRAAAYLSQTAAQLNHPDEVLTKTFGPALARLAQETLRLERVLTGMRAGNEDSPRIKLYRELQNQVKELKGNDKDP